MRSRGQKVRRVLGVVLAAVTVGVVGTLLTGWGGATASNISSVFITNTKASPVPVSEQNLDGGNVRVHEEGTAQVSVTNTTLATTQQPITGGSGVVNVPGLGAGALPVTMTLDQTAVATVLMIRLDAPIVAVELKLNGTLIAAFNGPLDGGDAKVLLPLTRPIAFNQVRCAGEAGNANCQVAWIGDTP